MTPEQKIILALRHNARQTLTEMSKITNIPISTLYDRIKNYQQSYVRRFTSLIDFSSLGYGTQASVTLKVKREKRDELRAYLLQHPNINTLQKVNNGYDFMFEVVFSHLKLMEEFLEHLEEQFLIKTKQVFYIIEDIAREKFMSDADIHGLLKDEP
ncbi:MAG: Lrp/AsnC family transcriptional regulator [Nanoarchaeota archaeon]